MIINIQNNNIGEGITTWRDAVTGHTKYLLSKLLMLRIAFLMISFFGSGM